MIAAIQAHHREGQPIGRIYRDNPNLYSAGGRYFGKWAEALRAAGFSPPVRRKWSREIVLRELRARYRPGVSRTCFWAENSQLAGAAKRYVGGKRRALICAGLSREDPRPLRKWSREDVIDAIQAWYRQGRSLKHLGREDPGLYASAKRWFGRWSDAVRAAGLDPNIPRHWSPDDVLDAMPIASPGGPADDRSVRRVSVAVRGGEKALRQLASRDGGRRTGIDTPQAVDEPHGSRGDSGPSRPGNPIPSLEGGPIATERWLQAVRQLAERLSGGRSAAAADTALVDRSALSGSFGVGIVRRSMPSDSQTRVWRMPRHGISVVYKRLPRRRGSSYGSGNGRPSALSRRFRIAMSEACPCCPARTGVCLGRRSVFSVLGAPPSRRPDWSTSFRSRKTDRWEHPATNAILPMSSRDTSDVA